ncbi:Nucleoside diphosphate kinase 7 [Lobulomyces angularis]|nr:Nucleoside diphosphate kinase 7 [Lobulomyces angularis]
MSEFNLTGLKMLDFEEVFVRHLAFKKEEERFGEEFGNRCTVFRLNKANAVEELVSLVETSPVLSKLKNLFYVPKNPAEVKETLNLVFGQENSNGGMKRTSTLYKGNKDQRKYFQTLCLIKPHAVNKFEHGSIINEILKENYFISDMELFNLESANAEEFLEVYKDVVPEYHLMLDQLTSGILVALEISGKNENIVCEFRNFCGPSDPELGRLIRPQTLRSKFGTDKIKNSVHCTDLTDDGVLEAEYFFKILVD